MLEVKDLTVQYGDLVILDTLSFKLEEGQWLMIAGPNGAGKSTIINAVSQGAPYSGEILVGKRDVKSYRSYERARMIGILSQHHHLNYSFSVEEIIRLGRYAYNPGIFSKQKDEDEEYIKEAIEMTGLGTILSQSVLTLSGGEIQRVFLAQLFAQNPHILMLDEPTNHLDLLYQKQIFGLLQEWLKKPGRAIVSVMHDLGQAKAYGSQALLLNKGKLAASGAIEQVLSKENLDSVYGMDVFSWMQGLLQQWQ